MQENNQTLSDSEYIVVGKIGTAYGVKGWIKIYSLGADDQQLLEYDPLYAIEKQHWGVMAIQDRKIHGKHIIIKLKGIDAPEQARLLNGKEIAVKRSQLLALKKNEYYWCDLKGLTVIDQHQQILGIITHLIETGANDVMVVKGDKEHAIPYLPNVVTSIDLEKREMHVNWEIL